MNYVKKMNGLNNYKCGEIYITYQGKYSYNCIICREWFDSIEYYEDHYMVQHFETKDLYGEDGKCFPIKIEPITDHDFEYIKSEVDSEQEDFTDLIDTEDYNRNNIPNKNSEHLLDEDSEERGYSDSNDTGEIVVRIDDNRTDDPDILEWNDSDQEISIDEINDIQENECNNENLDENNLLLEEDAQLTCQICFNTFLKAEYLNHVFQHKQNGFCPLCNKTVSNLKNHSMMQHRKILKNKDIKSETNLTKIKTKKRSEKKESISCKYCRKRFFLFNALEQHEKLHENRLLNCEYCDKSYSDLRFLRYHMRKHTGERPFKCQHCSAAFATKDNLNTHHIYKHTDTYNFSCTYENCDKKFKTNELRKRHIKNIHLKVLGYQCDICGQKFMTSSRLSIHRVKIHIDPKDWPFKCEICEKSFILQCKLKEHINFHTGEKPFKCELCHEKFMKRRALNDHIKKHRKLFD